MSGEQLGVGMFNQNINGGKKMNGFLRELGWLVDWMDG